MNSDNNKAELTKHELLKQLTSEEIPKPSASLKPFHLVIAVGIATLFGATAGYLLKPTPSQANSKSIATSSPQSTTVQTAQPANKPAKTPAQQSQPSSEAILNASGYITARRLATVSAEIMGLITEVTVEEGSKVEKGQILAQLDASKALVSLRLAKAQVQAQAEQVQSIITDLEEAQRVLTRFSRLGEENFASVAQRTRAEADVAKLKSALASAKANLHVAQLNVEQAQEHLDDHTIRAPYSGIITVKNAQPGEIVAPAAAGGGFTRTGICTLVDMQSLEIEVDVNEAYIGRVIPGQRVIANLDAYPQWDIPASVIAIIPTADRAKATVRVRIKIESSDQRILPNMGVKVAFFNEENR